MTQDVFAAACISSNLPRVNQRSKASMRQPTRPFITAYKNRSSKSRASDSWKIKEDESANAAPSLNELSALPAVEIEPDAAYLAALKAADAVFGREADKHPAVPPQPNRIPTGRVLPNLLQESVVNAPPASAASKKPRRARQPAKVKAPVQTPPKRPKRQAKAVAPTPSAQPARVSEPEIVLVTSRRAGRAIREKWVLKTTLKAGERWKRRLGKFAR
ncbi:hypothetical protein [Methylocystis sp.]|uniref:hypothetical protein n=1 Tax=Methylocystis sp. TaxID=1911079 RepID=UPI003D0EE310